MSEIEVIESQSALATITRAEIDTQIATAKQYQRSIAAVKQSMMEFATLDEETAASTFYTLPGRKGGDGKPLQGPSIRMAEIALSCYQNIRVGSRVISDDGKVITAQSICHDLQNNVSVSIEVQRRVTTKEGKRYSDDMVVTTGNAACSIAMRNAVFRVIPLALIKPVYEQAKLVAVGNVKTLVSRRAGAVTHFKKMGVDEAKIFAAAGVTKLEEIGLNQLELLLGYATAIKDGDTTVDEVFSRAVGEKKDPIKPFSSDDPEQPWGEEPASPSEKGGK